MRKILAATAVLALTSAAFGEVFATVGSPMGTVTISSEEVGQVEDLGNGTLRWTGSMENSAMGWGLDWNFEVNGDPFISGVAGFTNLMGAAAAFTFDISTNSTISIAAPIVNGASTITVLDTNSDGATMAAVSGDSIYRAFIGGTTEEILFADPFSLTAPVDGVDFDGTAWGPRAATTSISNGQIFGIDHDFELSAGDQATINSSFNIIPEPATLALLAIGGLFVARRR